MKDAKDLNVKESNKGYRISVSLDGDVAELFLSKKSQMPHGFKKLFIQKLTDDFISFSGKKELKKNIIKYISGEIKLKFKDDRPQISENSGNIQDGKLNELMKLKNNF
ncbi:MAG: hypothetical protein ACYCS0_00880 [bacterium]